MCTVVSPNAIESPGAVQIIVLSGPSGSGKTTIVRELLRQSPIKLTLSVSATTRGKRVGEVDGRDYYFLTHEEFRRRLEQDEFLEYAEVHANGNWYGTLKSEVERAKREHAWALLEIDVQGARKVLEQFPEAISIFLKTSDFEKRLRERATESEEVIQARLATAHEELKSADLYRYQVLNDNLQRAVEDVIAILKSHQLVGNPS